MDWDRIKYAAVWGVGMFLFQAAVAISAGGEASIPKTGAAWIVFACNAFVTAAAKYTSSTKMYGTNPRPTDEQRRAYLGLPPKRLP